MTARGDARYQWCQMARSQLPACHKPVCMTVYVGGWLGGGCGRGGGVRARPRGRKAEKKGTQLNTDMVNEENIENGVSKPSNARNEKWRPILAFWLLPTAICQIGGRISGGGHYHGSSTTSHCTGLLSLSAQRRSKLMVQRTPSKTSMCSAKCAARQLALTACKKHGAS